MEQVLVNISKAPVSVTLPSGRPILINPGFAVQGDYFLKFIDPGRIETLARIPAGFSVRGVSQPLLTDQTRDNNSSSSRTTGKLENKSNAKAALKTAGAALAAEGKELTVQNLAKNIPGFTGTGEAGEETFQGVTAATWISRIKAVSSSTLAQQTKLGDLKALAKFLGVASEFATKADLIEAVRLKAGA